MEEGGGKGKKNVCTSIYTPSSIYFHLTLELSLLLSSCRLSPSGYAWQLVAGSTLENIKVFTLK